MRDFVVPGLALLLAGCATTAHVVDMPSGRPEATVRASQAMRGIRSELTAARNSSSASSANLRSAA